MTELIETVGDATLPAFLTALLVFGFAPGFVLRLLVLLYPKSDSRRPELHAELYRMPRVERPMWVAEQIETALFEGIAERRRAARDREAVLRRLVGYRIVVRERRTSYWLLGFALLGIMEAVWLVFNLPDFGPFTGYAVSSFADWGVSFLAIGMVFAYLNHRRRIRDAKADLLSGRLSTAEGREKWMR